MSISDEDLIGLILGALEPDEADRVEKAVQQSPALQSRLQELSAAMGPLDDLAQEPVDPPEGLAERTLHFIESETQVKRSRESVEADLSSSQASRGLRSGSDVSSKSRTGSRTVDLLTLAGCVLVFAGLAFPSLLNARWLARLNHCQNNLKELGGALAIYAGFSPEGRIPQVPERGAASFAGVYSLRLHNAGLLENSNVLLCPSVYGTTASTDFLFPTPEELELAPEDVISAVRRSAGGSYAYNLGVRQGKRVAAPRWEGRTHFAWLGDAPVIQLEPAQSGSMCLSKVGSQQLLCDKSELEGTNFSRECAPPVQLIWLGHNGRGINIVFEDGHVSYFCFESSQSENATDIFLNHVGAIGAGLDTQDSALGPSFASPRGVILE